MTDKKLTGYAELLKENGNYPLKQRRPWKERGKEDARRKIATPYLVVPAFQGDNGARPLDAAHAHYSGAIRIVDSVTHAEVSAVVAGHTYSLSCRVHNYGAVGCFAGIAEFYLASPKILDDLAKGVGTRPAPLGYGAVMIAAGGDAVATCQHQWTVTDPSKSILVRIYDPIVDRPQHPFDSAADRHVARRDATIDFSGTYIGMESGNQIHKVPTQIKIVISQVGNLASISVYSQVGGSIPVNPQETFTAMVTGTTLTATTIEQLGGKPFTSNTWMFSLPNQNTLHFTHHRHYLRPGDGRPDADTNGDLARK